MDDKYYSEFISEKFYEKISALRVAKGIGCFKRLEFVFVNSNKCKCKNVQENHLKLTKVEDDILANITNIVVLGYDEWRNFDYINSSYTFIGIFDLNGNESIIDLGSIALNSFGIKNNSYFQIDMIYKCNVTISCNHFHEYLDRVITPIHKVVESFGHNLNLDYKITMDISPPYDSCKAFDFQSTLNYLKDFEQTLKNNMENTKFDPEISLKIKSSEIQF